MFDIQYSIYNGWVKVIKQEYKIKATIDKVWKCLVDVAEIEKWGGGPAVMDDKVGTEFKLWDGDIYGKNLEVAPNKSLVQEWYGGKWDKPSKVIFVLNETKDGALVYLHHEDVPEHEYEAIKDGWKRYYLGEIKKYLEKLT